MLRRHAQDGCRILRFAHSPLAQIAHLAGAAEYALLDHEPVDLGCITARDPHHTDTSADLYDALDDPRTA